MPNQLCNSVCGDPVWGWILSPQGSGTPFGLQASSIQLTQGKNECGESPHSIVSLFTFPWPLDPLFVCSLFV